MRATAFQPPYQGPRKTTFINSRWQSGVYLIMENDVLVYVGYAGECLYRTLYRHFQGWTDKNYNGSKVAPPSYRVSYRNKMAVNTYKVRLIHCSKKQAARLEKILILKHDPRDNRIKYEQYKLDAWDSRVANTYTAITEVPVEIEYCPF
jgi:hypothetical protein